MDVHRVKELIDLVAEADIAELTIADEKGEVHIVQRAGIEHSESARQFPGSSPVVRHSRTARADAGALSATSTSPASIASQPVTTALHQVKSPMVGTFHRSAKSDAGPLVEVGTLVEIGTPLCVIEAMKIMNEIEADKAGKVTQVLCEDGQAVDVDQPLFLID